MLSLMDHMYAGSIIAEKMINEKWKPSYADVHFSCSVHYLHTRMNDQRYHYIVWLNIE